MNLHLSIFCLVESRTQWAIQSTLGSFHSSSPMVQEGGASYTAVRSAVDPLSKSEAKKKEESGRKRRAKSVKKLIVFRRRLLVYAS